MIRNAVVAWMALLALVSARLAAQQVNPGVTAVPTRIVAGVDATQLGDDGAYALPPSVAPITTLNRHLPAWIRFTALDRIRLEGYSGLNYQPNNDDCYLLNRFRFRIILQPARWLRIYSEIQDARAFRMESPFGPPNVNAWDLRQAYVELGSGEDAPFNLKVGRQEVNFGRPYHRPVGVAQRGPNIRRGADLHSRASSTAHRFLSLGRGPAAARPESSPARCSGPRAVRAIDNLVPHSVIEPYLFWRVAPGFRTEVGNPGKLDERTAGVRWAGMVSPRFDYAVETAAQTGHVASDSISAWLASVVGGYTLASFRGEPRFFAEGFFSSSDGQAGDGFTEPGGNFIQRIMTGTELPIK